MQQCVWAFDSDGTLAVNGMVLLSGLLFGGSLCSVRRRQQEKGGKDMASQILVPLDGSSLAEQALSCAVTLGRGLSGELVLFRAVYVPSGAGQHLSGAPVRVSELLERLEAEADQYLRDVADRVKRAGLKVRHVVQHGPAAEAIVDYAEQIDIWSIVMATHGYSGIKRWTHGSVTERVLQAARVPVLVVRAQEEEAESSQKLTLCRRILVPLDGSGLAEQVLPVVSLVAEAVDADVFLFRVAVDQPATMVGTDWCFLPMEGAFEEEEREAEAYLERVADPLRDKGIQVSTATGIGPVADSIIEYAEANHIDLIAMCTHGRTGLARWAFGSVADRVLRAGGVPIFLIRAR
jgi:nucleotide-binding universal stress UspA family protein